MLQRREMAAALLIVAALFVPVRPGLRAQFVGPHDVAIGKSASQWRTYDPVTTADKAVDGDIDGGLFGPHMAVTDNGDPFGWWLVDLGGDFDISSITLWNRADCCPSRLNDLFVSILASGTATPSSFLAPTVFTQHVTTAIGLSQTFTPASGSYGRYVKVQYDGDPQFADTYLQLAEVDVEGQLHVTGTPEPSSLALLATGLLVAGARARRRRAL